MVIGFPSDPLGKEYGTELYVPVFSSMVSPGDACDIAEVRSSVVIVEEFIKVIPKRKKIGQNLSIVLYIKLIFFLL